MAFLADIVVNQPRGKEIHVSADSLSAHKTGQVEDFLAKRTSRKTGRETKRGRPASASPVLLRLHRLFTAVRIGMR